MPSINIYKIVEGKVANLFTHLDEAYECLAERIEEYIVPNGTATKTYTVKLFFPKKDEPSN